MAIPTVAECLTQARVHLNDVDAEKFTDTVLLPWVQEAFRHIYDQYVNHSLPLPERVAYYVLPSYTNVLSPAQAGISDFGELLAGGIEEADTPTQYTVSGATTASPIVLTVTGHPFSDYDDVIVYGVGGQTGANGRWFVTQTTNQLTLRGSTSVAAYTTGGKALAAGSTLRFTPLEEDHNLGDYTPSTQLRFFEWRDERFYFPGATEDRLLRMRYYSSGAAPSSGSIGIDNSLDVIANYTAMEACFANDRPSEGMRFRVKCFGDRLNPGLMYRLLNAGVKAQQRNRSQLPPYRPTLTNRVRGTRGRAPVIVV